MPVGSMSSVVVLPSGIATVTVTVRRPLTAASSWRAIQARSVDSSPAASSEWWRSIAEAIDFGRFQRRVSTPPTSAWSTPSSRRS